MTTKTKVAVTNGNGAHAETSAPKIMQLPETLALNFDSIGALDGLRFMEQSQDPAEIKWKFEFMDNVLVGGMNQYHFSLISPLTQLISRELMALLPQGQKKANSK